MEFKTKEIKTKEITLNFELEFHDSTLELEELENKVLFYFRDPYNKVFSTLIVDLLRVTHSSTWDIKKVELK